MENKELENAINELIRLKKILLVQCKEDVKNIIDNKVTAANYIESTLDKLLDFNDDEDFIGLAINAPQWDFVIATEDVHDCSE